MTVISNERVPLYQGNHTSLAKTFAVVGDVSASQQRMLQGFAQKEYVYDPNAQVTILFDTPVGFGLHCLQTAPRRTQGLIIITQNTCPEYWDDLYELAPSAVVMENNTDHELDAAFTAAQHRTTHRSMPRATSQLTLTERRVLRLLGCGGSNPQIAETIGVQHKTIRNLLTTVYEKLGVENRTDALLYYWGTWHGYSRIAR